MYDTKIVEQSITVMEESMPKTITNQVSYDQAVTYGKQVSKMEKFLDSEEKKITAPLNESLKAARALFKPYKEKCAEVKNAVKEQMTTYLNAEAAKKAEAEARDLARLERGTIKEETVVNKMVKREMESVDATGTTFKQLVIVSVDLSKVPSEYLILNESKVKADYRAGTEIPGVELTYETKARL